LTRVFQESPWNGASVGKAPAGTQWGVERLRAALHRAGSGACLLNFRVLLIL